MISSEQNLIFLEGTKVLTRKDLKPGMIVRNKVSDALGRILASSENPDELYPAYELCVYVAIETSTSAKRRRRRKYFWSLNNIEIEPPHTAPESIDCP